MVCLRDIQAAFSQRLKLVHQGRPAILPLQQTVLLSNGGQISIQNLATVSNPSALTPTSLTVTAPRITIFNDPNAINASSAGNVDAGSINILASYMLSLDPSGITTTANQGNGKVASISMQESCRSTIRRSPRPSPEPLETEATLPSMPILFS